MSNETPKAEPNPVTAPTAKPDARTEILQGSVPQKMRDLLTFFRQKYPKVTATIRLDVTPEGDEYSVHCALIPETDPKTRYGAIKAKTLDELKVIAATLP